MRRLLLLGALAAFVPCAIAQRMISPFPRYHGHQHQRHNRQFLDPFGYSYPLYPNYVLPETPVSPQPALTAQPAPTVIPEAAPLPPADALMIELQGDRYVQISGDSTSSAETVSSTLPSVHTSNVIAQSRGPAILVFRDGHREETASYTITSGMLYANGNYADGSWIRKIQLSSLDLPQTLQANEARSVKFRLPSAPNEVVVGP